MENNNSFYSRHKKLIAAATAIFSVIIFLSIFLTVWYWGDTYADFEDFKEEIAIPGLGDGAAPQGITTYKYNTLDSDGRFNNAKQQDYFFISAYFKDKPTRIYVTGKTTGYIGYVTVKNADNDNYYTGHAGGIATNGNTLWVSSGRTVYTAKTATNSGYTNIVQEVISKAKENGEIKFLASFNPNCRASFLYYYADPVTTSNDKLLVGEFYRSGNSSYDTAEEHKIQVFRKSDGSLINPKNVIVENGRVYNNNDGKKGDEIKGAAAIGNHSYMIEYRPYVSTSTTSDAGKYGVHVTTVNGKSVPSIQSIYSIPDEIQGVAIHTFTENIRNEKGEIEQKVNRTLVLSQSYGLKNSHLLCYDFSKVSTNNSLTYNDITGKDFEYAGAGAYNYPISINFVDGKNLTNDYSVPCMSEGLCVVNGTRESRVCVLFESGARKYKTFVRQQVKSVYSFVPKSK